MFLFSFPCVSHYCVEMRFVSHFDVVSRDLAKFTSSQSFLKCRLLGIYQVDHRAPC